MRQKNILKMDKISKSFPGVNALDQVCFDLNEGEIHILCGENGAGKSTLMKILAGIYTPEEGKMFINNKEVEIGNIRISEKLGIAIIHQEFKLSPTISVAENIFLGREKIYKAGIINRKKMYSESTNLLGKIGCKINPNTLLRNLTTAQTQMVQIAKALSLNSKILIMDEPFSTLTEEDSENLFEIMSKLKNNRVSIVYIDHRIENFFKIGDRITVLRDGKNVETDIIANLDRTKIVSMMVGRKISKNHLKYNKVTEKIAISVNNLNTSQLKNINFNIRKGEIFGLAGLVGSGRSEVVRAIFGVYKNYYGLVKIEGKEVKIKNPSDAIKNGIGYLAEDRKLQSLFFNKEVKFNGTIVYLDNLAKIGIINSKEENKIIQKFINFLKIKTTGINADVADLSGGNQQKLVLSRWLMMEDLKILLLDEPTRGIDVGAKFELYKIINDLANKGVAIILITSELPELLGLSDRIAVMKNGKISGILNRDEITQEKVMHLCV